jgi:hypothetical protein|nr:MAG TPA: hypothetical protein [Caudoviricetes sp.]
MSEEVKLNDQTPKTTSASAGDVLKLGIQEDGSEIVEVTGKAYVPKVFSQNPGKLVKVGDEKSDNDPKRQFDVKNGGKVITPAGGDGSKIYDMGDGRYIDLNKYLTKEEAHFDDWVMKSELAKYVLLDDFRKRLDQFVTIDSYNAKFGDYLSKRELEDIKDELNARFQGISDNHFTKHEVNVIISNIDRYSRVEVDHKVEELRNQVINGNNEIKEKIKDLADVNFIKEKLVNFYTKAEIEDIKSNLQQAKEEAIRTLTDVTVPELIKSATVGKYITPTELNESIKGFLSSSMLDSALNNYVPRAEYLASLDKLATKNAIDNLNSRIVPLNQIESLVNTRATKEDLRNLTDTSEGKLNGLSQRLDSLPDKSYIATQLETYATKNEVEGKIVTVKELFKNYYTSLKSDELLEGLKNDLIARINLMLPKSEFDSAKALLETKDNVNQIKNDLEAEIIKKADKLEFQGKIDTLKLLITNLNSTAITEVLLNTKLDEVKALFDDYSTKGYTTQEINKLKNQVDQEILSARQDYYNKSSIDDLLNDKIGNTELKALENTLRQDLDSTVAINKKVDKETFDTALENIHTKQEVQGLLANYTTNDQIAAKETALEEKMTKKDTLLKNELNTKIDTVSNTVTNNKVQLLAEIQEVKETVADGQSKINRFETKFDDYSPTTEVERKIQTASSALDSKIDSLKGDSNTKISTLSDRITPIETSIRDKVEQTDIDNTIKPIKISLESQINNLNSTITGFSNSLADYVLSSTYNSEKIQWVKTNALDHLSTTVDTNKSTFEAYVAKTDTAIKSLEDRKLDKTELPTALGNYYTREQIDEKIVPSELTYKKTEVDTLINALKSKITVSDKNIADTKNVVNALYSNGQIDNMLNVVRQNLSNGVSQLSRRLDNKVENDTFGKELVKLNTAIDSKASKLELSSAIATNNRNYSTTTEMMTILDRHKTIVENDIKEDYTNTKEMDKKFALYTPLSTYEGMLPNLVTKNYLTDKIREINSITRDEVEDLVNTSKNEVNATTVSYVTQSLTKYTPTATINSLLDLKLNKSEFTTKWNMLPSLYVDKTAYDGEKSTFITQNNIYGLIDARTATTLSNYYTKEKTDEMISNVSSNIASSNNLFYTKSVMDNKLGGYETRVDADVKKQSFDTEVLKLNNKFNDYPTIADLNAKLAGLGFQGNTQDFYDKPAIDKFLLKKVDIDIFNTLSNDVYRKSYIDTTLEDYVKKTQYTSAVNDLQTKVSTIEGKDILSVNKNQVVLKTELGTVLDPYYLKNNLNTDVNQIVTTKLTDYVSKEDLKTNNDTLKQTLVGETVLADYLKKNVFESFKESVYEKQHVDDIDSKFANYTTTTELGTKLTEINSRILTREEIEGLVQSQGGKNYTKNEINGLLAAKVSTPDLNQALEEKETKYTNDFLSKLEANTLYQKKTDLSNILDDYLKLNIGGTVTGSTTFSNGLESNTFKTASIDLSSGDIINGRSATFELVRSNNINNTETITTKNLTADSTIDTKNLVVETKLTLPNVKFPDTKSFMTLNPTEYTELSKNFNTYTIDNLGDVVLNIGLPTGNFLENKLIKFNIDGSISTRTIKEGTFLDDWTELAKKSDLTTLESTLSSRYVTTQNLTTKLNDYVNEYTLSTRLGSYYDKNIIDAKVTNLTKQINGLTNSESLNELLKKKASQEDFNELKTNFNQYKIDTYTKNDIDTSFKPAVIREVNNTIESNYVTKSLLSTTLVDYLNESKLQTKLTEHGAAIMSNISSNYVTLTTLEGRLDSYYNKDGIDSKLRLLTSKAELATTLNDYATKAKFDEYKNEVDAKVDNVSRVATKSRDDLNDFKGLVSTTYITLENTKTLISKSNTQALTNYYDKSEIESKVSTINNTANENKDALERKIEALDTKTSTKDREIEANLSGLNTTLTKKDRDLEVLITANTTKFNDYVTTAAHEAKVRSERQLSDDKYAPKAGSGNYALKSELTTELAKKYNSAGGSISGNVDVNGTFRSNGAATFGVATANNFTSNVVTVNNTLITPRVEYKDNAVPTVWTKTYSSQIFSKVLTVDAVKKSSVNLLMVNKLEHTNTGNAQQDISTKFGILRLSNIENGGTLEFAIDTVNVHNEAQADTTMPYPTNWKRVALATDLDNLKNQVQGGVTSSLSTVTSKVDTLTSSLNSAKTELKGYSDTKFNQLKNELRPMIVGNTSRFANYYTSQQVDQKIKEAKDSILNTTLPALETRIKAYIDTKVEEVMNAKLGEISKLLDKINGAEI